MTIAQNYLAELKQEAEKSKKMLALVPMDKSSWKPHEKSMTLNRLAVHVAEMVLWLEVTITTDELDYTKGDYKPFVPETSKELLDFYDTNLKKAEEALANCSDERMMKNWTMKAGDRVVFSIPRVAVIRDMILNHQAHHRGQLSVYLRLLDVPLPSIYGPTADDKSGM